MPVYRKFPQPFFVIAFIFIHQYRFTSNARLDLWNAHVADKVDNPAFESGMHNLAASEACESDVRGTRVSLKNTPVSLKSTPVSLNSTQVSLNSSPVSLTVSSLCWGCSCLARLPRMPRMPRWLAYCIHSGNQLNVV